MHEYPKLIKKSLNLYEILIQAPPLSILLCKPSIEIIITLASHARPGGMRVAVKYPPPHASAWLGRAKLIPRTRGLASAPPSPSGSPHPADQFPRQPLSALVSPLGPLWPLFTPEISILGSPWPPFALLGALQAPLVVQDRPPSAPSVPQVTTMTPHDLNTCPK